MTNEEIKNQLYGLKSLYNDLLASCNSFKDLWPFFTQWGRNYYQHIGNGIVVYGRATNGWITNSRNVDEWFDSDNRIFNVDWQMQWVENCWFKQPNKKYHCSKSAFWRVIRGVSEHFYPDNWSSHICWSDICKIAPDGANPDAELYKAQLCISQEIMKAEINILNPKHIILFIGSWGKKDYLTYLNGGVLPSQIDEASFGKQKISVYRIDNRYFYATAHPQGKPETEHIRKLIELIQKYSL